MSKKQTGVPAVTQAKPLAPTPVKPSRLHPESRPNIIANLSIGQTDAMVTRLSFDGTTKEDVAIEINRLKGIMCAAAARATARTGNNYITEVADVRTRIGELLIVAAVTRLT